MSFLDVPGVKAGALDTSIEAKINDTGSATRGALNATILEQGNAAFIPKWKPNTAYAVNDRVIAPSGDSVLAKTNFTTGAAYDPANWNLPLNLTNKLALADSRQRLGNKWAFLGDSIMVGGWSGLLHSDTWPTYAALYSKGKIQIVANAGVSGDNTTQMLARIQADVISKAPQVCAIGGGTNDISQGVTLATFKSNIASIVAALRSANIAPVLTTITPNAVSAARTASTALWNQWIRRYAAEQQIPLIDFYAMMADPTNGQFKSGFNSGDNIHPGAEGYRAMGEHASTVMAQHLQPAALPLAVDAGDTYNLLQSPTFMTDGGGGLAPGWVGIRTGTGTRTHSLVTDSSIVGKWQQTDATAWTADAGHGNYQNTDLANKFVAGDKVAVSGLLSVPNLDPASTIVVEFKANPVTAWYVVNQLTRPIAGIVAFYGEYTMPSGFTGYELDAYLKNPLGGTNTGTIKTAQVSLYNLTKHGL